MLGHHFCRQLFENLLYPVSSFGRYDSMLDSIVLSLLSPFLYNLVFLWFLAFDQIAFICNKESALIGDVLFRSLCEVVIASFDRIDIADIIYAQASVTALIVGGCQSSKFLLSSSVPDLERVVFVIDG